MVQPNGMADNLGGEAMAVVRVEWRLHVARLARLRPARQTPLP